MFCSYMCRWWHKTVNDFTKMLKAGADKCSINTAAIKNPELINKASKVVGSQACVVAIDAKRRYVNDPNETDKIVVKTEKGYCWYECSIYGGRKFTGIDAIAWAMECEERGAGEILLTSMDRDGTKEGYDIPLIKEITKEWTSLSLLQAVSETLNIFMMRLSLETQMLHWLQAFFIIMNIAYLM